jgi:hypothetical protein
MLIRREQWEDLESKLLERFESRMVAHLREFFPELTEAKSEDELRKFVRDEIEVARQFDIEEEGHVAVYVCAMFALRPEPDTDTEPTWVKEVLADPELSAAEKVERLEAWVEEELKEMEADESA